MDEIILKFTGGSGLYNIPGIKNSWKKISTNHGEPSSDICIGEINKRKVAFLPRHGKSRFRLQRLIIVLILRL